MAVALDCRRGFAKSGAIVRLDPRGQFDNGSQVTFYEYLKKDLCRPSGKTGNFVLGFGSA